MDYIPGYQVTPEEMNARLQERVQHERSFAEECAQEHGWERGTVTHPVGWMYVELKKVKCLLANGKLLIEALRENEEHLYRSMLIVAAVSFAMGYMVCKWL